MCGTPGQLYARDGEGNDLVDSEGNQRMCTRDEALEVTKAEKMIETLHNLENGQPDEFFKFKTPGGENAPGASAIVDFMSKYAMTKQTVKGAPVVVGEYWPLARADRLTEPAIYNYVRNIPMHTLEPGDGIERSELPKAQFYDVMQIADGGEFDEKLDDERNSYLEREEVETKRREAMQRKKDDDIDDIAAAHMQKQVWKPPFTTKDINEMEFVITQDRTGKYGYVDDEYTSGAAYQTALREAKEKQETGKLTNKLARVAATTGGVAVTLASGDGDLGLRGASMFEGATKQKENDEMREDEPPKYSYTLSSLAERLLTECVNDEHSTWSTATLRDSGMRITDTQQCDESEGELKLKKALRETCDVKGPIGERICRLEAVRRGETKSMCMLHCYAQKLADIINHSNVDGLNQDAKLMLRRQIMERLKLLRSHEYTLNRIEQQRQRLNTMEPREEEWLSQKKQWKQQLELELAGTPDPQKSERLKSRLEGLKDTTFEQRKKEWMSTAREIQKELCYLEGCIRKEGMATTCEDKLSQGERGVCVMPGMCDEMEETIEKMEEDAKTPLRFRQDPVLRQLCYMHGLLKKYTTPPDERIQELKHKIQHLEEKEQLMSGAMARRVDDQLRKPLRTPFQRDKMKRLAEKKEALEAELTNLDDEEVWESKRCPAGFKWSKKKGECVPKKRSNLKLDEFGQKTLESATWLNDRNPSLAVQSPGMFALAAVLGGLIRTYEIPGARAMVLPFLPSSGVKVAGVSGSEAKTGRDLGTQFGKGGDGIRETDDFVAFMQLIMSNMDDDDQDTVPIGKARSPWSSVRQRLTRGWFKKKETSAKARSPWSGVRQRLAGGWFKEVGSLRDTFDTFANDKGVIDTEGLRRLIEDYDMSDADLLEFMKELTEGADTMTFAQFKRFMETTTPEEEAAAKAEEYMERERYKFRFTPNWWTAPDLDDYQYMRIEDFVKYWAIVNSSQQGRPRACKGVGERAFLADGKEASRVPRIKPRGGYGTGLDCVYMGGGRLCDGDLSKEYTDSTTQAERNEFMTRYLVRKMVEAQTSGLDSGLYTEGNGGKRSLTDKGKDWIRQKAEVA